MTALTLYELAAEYKAAADKLADLDLPAEVVTDTLASLTGGLEVKAQNIAMLARNMDTTAESIRDAIASMQQRVRAIEARASHLRQYLLANMQYAGITRLECALFRVSVRDNPPAVDVFDTAQVPTQFMRQPDPPPPSPDKNAIREALKHGNDVPGCRLTQSQRVDIR